MKVKIAEHLFHQYHNMTNRKSTIFNGFLKIWLNGMYGKNQQEFYSHYPNHNKIKA